MTLLQAVRLAKASEGFSRFNPPLEEQLEKDTDKLFFEKDVSGGYKQMFLVMWVRFDKEPKE